MTTPAFTPHVIFGLDPMAVSTAILLATYGAIIWDKLNRSIVALHGASLMILVGVLDQGEAVRGIGGGNGTLVGASANLTVAGLAERNAVPFRLLTYTAYASR